MTDRASGSEWAGRLREYKVPAFQQIALSCIARTARKNPAEIDGSPMAGATSSPTPANPRARPLIPRRVRGASPRAACMIAIQIGIVAASRAAMPPLSGLTRKLRLREARDAQKECAGKREPNPGHEKRRDRLDDHPDRDEGSSPDDADRREGDVRAEERLTFRRSGKEDDLRRDGGGV